LGNALKIEYKLKFPYQKTKLISILISIGIIIELMILVIDFSVLPSNYNDALTIEFKGSNQTWQFQYSGNDGILNTVDDIVVSNSNNLFLPKNSKITIDMISKDYIYCIDIPELNESQFAIPDLKFTLNFSTENFDSLSFIPGSICGRVNDDLYRKVYIVSNQDFLKWMNSQNLKL